MLRIIKEQKEMIDMREGRFRGKRINGDKEWRYGFLWVNESNGDHFIVCSDDSKQGWKLYNVDSKTVGQYIGRKDKNGKKVYDDDIIDLPGYHEQMVVRYGFISADAEAIGYELFDEDDAIVIGNTHDNPELRKDKS